MKTFLRHLFATDQILAKCTAMQQTLQSLEVGKGPTIPVEGAASSILASAGGLGLELPEVCELRGEHLVGAKLFANRNDLIESLSGELKGKVVAEIGVLLGEFSMAMLRAFQPAEFVAFDLFDLHLSEHPWAKGHAKAFKGASHLEYYRQTVTGYNVKLEVGLSDKSLSKYENDYCDMIYVDGDHSVPGVRADADVAARKVKSGGILVFNDYIMYDWNVGDFYGIVPVVNELVVNHGYQVIGFAFQRNLFCDIAIRRPS